MYRTAVIVLLWLAMPPGPLGSGPAAAGNLDEAAESTVWLLQKAAMPHRENQNELMLRALWRLRDPALQPFFSQLVQKSHPRLKAMGILGLAELSPQRRIDLALLADLKDARLQADVVAEALKTNLLDAAQVRQILAWPALDPTVRIILLTKLVADGELSDTALIGQAEADAQAAGNTGAVIVAALLRLQVGDATALEALEALRTGDEPNRHHVQAWLLQTALNHKLDAAGPWARKIAADPATEPDLGLIALSAALTFKAPGAQELWTQRYADADRSLADRIRMAMLALDVAEKVSPGLFDPLLSDEDSIIQQLGRAGHAIASGQPAEEPLMKLLEANHAAASNWALKYAVEAEIDVGRPILVGIILAAEGGENPVRFRGQRLQRCVLATQRLIEADSASHPLVRKLLETSPGLTQEAILMGLIRSNLDDPHEIIQGVESFETDTAAAMALLLHARQGADLDEGGLRRLALIVRGAAGLQDPLRLQAGWVYLKRTQQDQFALPKVLN